MLFQPISNSPFWKLHENLTLNSQKNQEAIQYAFLSPQKEEKKEWKRGAVVPEDIP